MDILLPPISFDQARTVVSPLVARIEGHGFQVDPNFVDVVIKGILHDDPTPQSSKDETTKGVAVSGDQSSTKRHIAWVDSPFSRGVGASTIGKCLLQEA